MWLRQISAIGAIFVGISLTLILIANAYYSHKLGRELFQWTDAMPAFSATALIAGGALTLWRQSIAILIAAWMWMAALSIRHLAAEPLYPAYLRTHQTLDEMAILRRAYEYSIHLNRVVGLVYLFVSLSGIVLSVWDIWRHRANV